MQRGELEDAEVVLREVESLRLESVGEEDDGTIRVMNNLASVLSEQGKNDEALVRYRRALELQLRTQGERHPEALMARNNLGTFLIGMDRAAEAVPLLERALELKREILPPADPSMMVGFVMLGRAYPRCGAPARGRGGVGRGRGLRRRALARSPVHRDGGAGVGRVARAARPVAGTPSGREYRHFFEIAPATLSAKHPTAASAGLAYVLFEQGELAEAETTSRRAVADAERIYPPGDPVTAVYRVRHGYILGAAGKTGEAVGALEVGLRDLASDSRWRPRAVRELASALADLGRHADADRWLRELERD